MTQTQRAAMDATLARAERNGIAVMGQGMRKSDGAHIFAVSSASQSGRWYLVAIEAGHLHCDCPARGFCKHRAKVHARLCSEHAAELAREAERAYRLDLASEGNAAALAPSL